MPYWQASDTHHDDPIWAALAQGRPDVVDRLQAAWSRLMSLASRQRSDGYLTSWSALTACHGRQPTLDLLRSQPLADVAPLVHAPGDECDCLDEEWRAGYDLRLHAFLRRNPSRRENDRAKTQDAERRDPRIKSAVYDRDGGCCRYCNSGPIPKKGMGRAKDRRRALHLDHVDPDKTAGGDLSNLVTACARCNQEKGARTPQEADMVLLPAPAPETAAAWLQRPEELHDLPPAASSRRRLALVALAPAPVEAAPGDVDNDNDNDSDNASTTPGQRVESLSESLSHPLSVPVDVDVGPGPSHATSTGQPCPQAGDVRPGQPPPESASCVGSGGVGPPPACPSPAGSADARGQPARGPTDTDIYHRRSRGGPR